MAGPDFDPDSTRHIGPALDPDNDTSAELLARYRVIDAAEQRTLKLLARDR